MGNDPIWIANNAHLRPLTGSHPGDERVHELCQKVYFMHSHTNTMLADDQPG